MEATPEYEALMNVIKTRMSVRRFKPDPVPDEHIERIIEAGRWAMSGANSQPWEFVVVRDPETKQKLYDTYKEVNADYSFWLEQMRVAELRHPAFHVTGDPEEQYTKYISRRGWADAPVAIVVLGDGRKQWGTVLAGMTYGHQMTHLTDGLANASQNIHLAAASLGLGSQWITINIQEPFRRILNVPDMLMVYLIIPIGYPAVERRPGYRREMGALVHYDSYDQSRYLTNKQIVEYIRELRQRTIPVYASSARPKPQE